MAQTGTELLNFQKGSKALYIQIKELYKEQILNGQIKHGERLDSEAQIQKLFGVSRITARQAILDLEREGLVNRGRGRGTFVIWQSPKQKEEAYEDEHWRIHPCKKKQGELVFQQIVREYPPEEIIGEFNLPEEQMMYCQVQIFGSDNIPLSFSKTWYAGSEKVQEKEGPVSRSEIHQRLLNHVNENQRHYEESLRAMIPDQEVRAALRISDEVPVLCRTRKTTDGARRLLSIELDYSRGDMSSYCLRATIQNTH